MRMIACDANAPSECNVSLDRGLRVGSVRVMLAGAIGGEGPTRRQAIGIAAPGSVAEATALTSKV
ncbi:MAG: hypothetical protein ABSF83_04625 [Nitrososphaerales archaeon]|jgi:hypothetical protein